jgi:hypothetical protein
MWLLVAREPRPDAQVWAGRRWLAAVDAVAWPAAWGLAFSQIPEAGVVGPFVSAVAVLSGIGRLHRALCVNERYWFTTWRWGKIVAGMLFIGFVMKLSMPG